MNLTYTRPGELRKPDVRVLPDGRIRITRYIAAGHGDRDQNEITQSFGSTDGGLNTALLVEKGMARIEGKDAIVKTWEVRNPTGETPVGNEDVQWGENGLKTVIADFVQMSTQPYTPQTVGVTASTYDATCILRNEVMEDDGSTRQIRRFYINKGLLKQVDETRNNGALLIRSLTYLNDTPAAGLITGYTLINQNRDNPSGLPTTTYTYAKGSGEITSLVEYKNNSKLIVYKKTSLGVVPATPSATIGGTVVLINSDTRQQDGYVLYDYTWAEGLGLVDTNTESKLNGALLRTTLTYLTASTVTTNPTTDPFTTGGTVVNTDSRDVDGHRIWTVTWVKAIISPTVHVVDTIDYRNIDKDGNALLTIYRRQRLGQQPATPAVGVVMIEDTQQVQDGYTLYTRSWAKGVGTISTSTEYKNQNRLTIYTETALGAAPNYPTGGWLLIDESVRIENGVNVYMRRWAQGSGVIEQRTQPRDGGLRIETWVSLGQTYDAGFMKPIGVLAAKDSDYLDGYIRWTVSCFQKSDGTAPDSGIALQYTTKRPFTYPGRAKAYATSVIIGGGVGTKTNYDVYKSPPVTALVDAIVSITYQTSSTVGALSYPLWNPTEWATVRSWYLMWNAAPGAVIESLPNYRADGGYSSVAFNGGVTGYQESAFGNRLYALGGFSAPYFITVQGGPVAPDGNGYTIEPPIIEPAFVSYDGVQYYRRIVVSCAIIPAQAALPV